jgi:asparagine N-glycosylation enzyme membrane subunit Stt3
VRIAQTVHSSIGLVAVILALTHEITVVVTRHGIKPFSALGWLPEQLLVGVAILLPGLLMLGVARRGRARMSTTSGVITAGVLALAMLLLFTRYFDGLFATLAFAALVDGVLLSAAALATGRRRTPAILQLAFVTCALTGAVLLFGASYLGAGSEPAIVESPLGGNPRLLVVSPPDVAGDDPGTIPVSWPRA